MNLIRGRVERDTGGRTNNCCRWVAGGGAICRGHHLITVVTAMGSTSNVAEHTIEAHCVGGVMMGGAGRVGDTRMTCQASYAGMRRGTDTKASITINSHNRTAKDGCPGATSCCAVTSQTKVLVNASDNTFSRNGVATCTDGASGKVGRRMTSMGDTFVRMAIKTANSNEIILNNR